MTENIYFDTDCISSFLWVNREDVLIKLYSGRMVIPKPVFDELSNPTIPHIKQKIDNLIKKGHADLVSIYIDSEAYTLYQKLTTFPDAGFSAIGKGETAAIVLAKINNGILASNNLKDISPYVQIYNLNHITTGDILIEALKQGHISENEGNMIWYSMLSKKRRLGARSFTDYLIALHSYWKSN